jgi:hypothetical protein
MKQKRRQPKGKLIKPTFFVFCEGETEETYIKYLRSLYRLPIEIDPKIAGNRITDKYISNYKKQKTIHPKDKTFLIYDSDVESVLEKLKKIRNANLLCSNPCFELWYLLHFINQNAELSSDECVSKLINNVRHYQKGNLEDKLKAKLFENKNKAITRAKSLSGFANPSTSIYKFVEELEKIAKKQSD